MLSHKNISADLCAVVIDNLHSYPKLSSNNKLRKVFTSLYHRKFEGVDRYSWPNALLAISLENYYNSVKDSDLLNEIEKYADNYIKSKTKINAIDNTMNGYTMLFLCELGKNDKYKDAILKLKQYLYSHDKDKYGSLIYRDEDIYVDTIGMICPFLCRYAKAFNDDTGRELAVLQIRNFMDYGMDEKSGLPYHGYNSKSGLKKGIIGWGRGTGWLLLGVIDSLLYLDENDEDYAYLARTMQGLADTVMQHQLESGFFTWQVGASSGVYDTSATAMILYAVQRALSLGIIDSAYHHNVEVGVDALMDCFKKNAGITKCSGECGGFGVYPQRYGVYPWSTAPTFSLLSLIKDCYINNS